MSLNGYIDNLIAKTKDAKGSAHCDKARIISIDGSMWMMASHVKAFKVTNFWVIPFSLIVYSALHSKDG